MHWINFCVFQDSFQWRAKGRGALKTCKNFAQRFRSFSVDIKTHMSNECWFSYEVSHQNTSSIVSCSDPTVIFQNAARLRILPTPALVSHNTFQFHTSHDVTTSTTTSNNHHLGFGKKTKQKTPQKKRFSDSNIDNISSLHLTSLLENQHAAVKTTSPSCCPALPMVNVRWHIQTWGTVKQRRCLTTLIK